MHNDNDPKLLRRLQHLFQHQTESIILSAALSPSPFEQPGNFVIQLKEGHRFGLFIHTTRWPLTKAPYFFFTLNDPDHELVIDPGEQALRLERVPKSWIPSTYGRQSNTTRCADLPGGNVPRDIHEATSTRVSLTSRFIENASAMQNSLGRVHIVLNRKNKQIGVANHVVNHARDETQAVEILNQLSFLLSP